MAAYEGLLLLLCSLLWNFSPAGGKEDCVLPCQFQSDGEGVRVMWYKKKDVVSCTRHGNTSFVVGRYPPAPEYKGRTRLYEDQVLKGNATLVLKNITPKDQGKYVCITYTAKRTKESGTVTVDVKALVNIQQVGDQITCSSEGIHPEPELTWSTDPPSILSPDLPTIHQTEQQLYKISSSLIVTDTDLVYSCNVSSGMNWRRATLFKPIFIDGADTEQTIPCTSSNTLLAGFRLAWRFNHSQIIVSQNQIDTPYTVSQEWRQQVKDVSESGSLTLQDLSQNQQGKYTCELSNDEETYVTNIFLRTSLGSRSVATSWPKSLYKLLAVITAVPVVLAAGIVGIALCACCWGKPGRRYNRYSNYVDVAAPL